MLKLVSSLSSANSPASCPDPKPQGCHLFALWICDYTGNLFFCLSFTIVFLLHIQWRSIVVE